jgi:hypothetical protein
VDPVVVVLDTGVARFVRGAAFAGLIEARISAASRSDEAFMALSPIPISDGGYGRFAQDRISTSR